MPLFRRKRVSDTTICCVSDTNTPGSLVFINISCKLYIEKVFLSFEIFFIIFQNKLQKSVKEMQTVLLRFLTIQRTGKKSQIIESLSISATDKAGIYAKLTMK